MKTETYTTYAPKTDMTFILCDTFDDVGEVEQTEVIGWYYGEPNDEATSLFAGDLVAVYK